MVRSLDAQATVAIIVEVGKGSFRRYYRMNAIFPPHTGDELVIGDDVVTCESVRFHPDINGVTVRNSRADFTYKEPGSGWTAEWPGWD